MAPPAAGANAPTAGGNYSGVGGNANSSFTAVVLGIGVAATNYNFPELRRVNLGGYVYVDANANGVRDAATDPPIAGATVRLLNASTNAVLATAVTSFARCCRCCRRRAYPTLSSTSSTAASSQL